MRELGRAYVAAWDRGDVDALVALLAEDARCPMPPLPDLVPGRDAITAFLETGPMPLRWRHRVTHANGQPAVGCYLWDEARGDHHGRVIDVLTLDGPRIAAVTSFIGHEAFARFGLPDALP